MRGQDVPNVPKRDPDMTITPENIDRSGSSKSHIGPARLPSPPPKTDDDDEEFLSPDVEAEISGQKIP